MLADLHVHSHYSDGSMSPKELLRYARQFGVSVLALTDHDTIAGYPEAKTAGEEQGIEVLCGVELSIDYPMEGRSHLHIVGLMVNPDNKNLTNTLDFLKQAREERMKDIVSRMQSAGMDIDYKEVCQRAGKGCIGRPHLAELMLVIGYVVNMGKAYTEFLAAGCKFHVPKKKLQLEKAVSLIHESGGLAFIAHPYSLGFKTYPPLGKEILKFREMGVDGIEAYYAKHDRYFTRWLLDFARENDLLVSGGSDFHGRPKPSIKPGVGYGDLKIPLDVVTDIKNAVKMKKAV